MVVGAGATRDTQVGRARADLQRGRHRNGRNDRTASEQRARWNVRAAIYEMPGRLLDHPVDVREWVGMTVAAVTGAASAAVLFVREHRKTSLAALAVLLFVFMLYGPARDCYVSCRMNEDLQMRYDAIVTENKQFSEDISRLQSREGIEDLARARGFVGEGETSVSVEGLPEEAKRDASATAEYVDERSWQQKALDSFFGYDPVGAFK